MAYLEIKDLHVSVEGKQILKGINLRVEDGQICALMGPNGSGKSTLSAVIMGHPKYKVEKGQVILNGKDVLSMQPHERAELGLFLAFQNPTEVPGVGLSHLLWTIYRKKHGLERPTPQAMAEFKKEVTEKLQRLGLDSAFMDRDVNGGLSGGERKRTEALQMLLAEPAFALVDEIDSGLDIDSLKAVAGAVDSLRGADFGALVITHYQRILDYLKPDTVHIIQDGKIAASGGPELVQKLEQQGYGWLKDGE
jgi:Fe-S cluster assembly ATP-binding protein